MPNNRRNLLGIVAVLTLVIGCFVGIWILSADARREIDALATANADSSQWTIAQSEVELLSLEAAILMAIQDGSDMRLTEVRRRFDVLYSRLQTLENAQVFNLTRQDEDVRAAISRVTDFLDRTVPLIDGQNTDLLASLHNLALQVRAVRRDLRIVSLELVRVFAIEAGARRESVAKALTDLAVLTLVLVLVLLGTVLALVWSLTQGRRRTAEIARAQSRLRTIVATSFDGVLVVGRDGRILDFNSAAQRIFGYSPQEALGQPMADLIIPDHLLDAHRAGMETHLITGQKSVLGRGLVQLKARDKTGRVFPVELSLSTAESEDGEIFVAFVRDISDRLAAERELVRTRDKALAGEEAKAEFLAVMSHEMRTPLNGILGGLELLSETELSGHQKGLVEVMDSSGQMLLDHVNTVLDISRADAGKAVLRSDHFDLGQLLHNIVESQSVQATARNNQLELAPLPADLGSVIGDKIKLRQAIVNLVANAIKFTSNGHITLEACRLDDTGQVDIRIIDTGIGIEPEDLPRIFDDFVTLDGSYSREVEGTGLGLGIVRRLVAAMGGDLGAESTPDLGSIFWLRLPLPAAIAPPSPSIEPPDPTEYAVQITDGLSVLVVEDNEINRLIAREMLTRLGCTTTEAENGQAGVDLAGASRFDLILMDVSMPVVDGIEATRKIRTGSGPNATTPIVALTAHALPADFARFHDAGMSDVVVKPLALARMLDLLRKVASDRSPSSNTLGKSPDSGMDPSGRPELPDALHLRAIAEIDAFLGQLNAIVAGRQEMTELRQVAHNATGLAAVAGLIDLRDAFATLEIAATEMKGEEGEQEALADMLSTAQQIFDTRTSDRNRTQINP